VPKILLVDDDAKFIFPLAARLRTAGYEADVALSAHEASALVHQVRPDLIVLDMEMPRYTGLEFHECLRQTHRGRDIPVVYLSDEESLTKREAAEKLGGKGVLVKPITACELMVTVRGALASLAKASIGTR